MKINVKHIAKLANLEVKDEDLSKFEKQLSEVLDYVKKLDEVDVKGVKPTSQVTGLENILRVDTAEPSLTQKEATSNAKHTYNGFFQVKGILDNE